MPFQNPSDVEVRALLLRVKNIAVVGLSPQPDHPVLACHKLCRQRVTGSFQSDPA